MASMQVPGRVVRVGATDETSGDIDSPGRGISSGARALDGDHGTHHPKGTVYETGHFEDWEVLIAETGPETNQRPLKQNAQSSISQMCLCLSASLGVSRM